MQKTNLGLVSILVFLFIVIGCSNNNEKQEIKQSNEKIIETQDPPPVIVENKPEPPQPVTLKLFFVTPPGNEYYENIFVQPIRNKFPHVTLEPIHGSDTVKLANLVAANDIPDIIADGLTNFIPIIALDVPLDMDPLVKKYNFDLKKIEPTIISDVRSYSEKGELLFWPQKSYLWALHYNKDIFDKFGVDYPKDGSTWEELIEISKNLSRTYEGVNYRGLSPGSNLNRLQTQMSLPFVDLKTQLSIVGNHEGWKKLFQTYKDIYSVPGNYPEGSTYNDGNTAFNNTKNLAMFPNLLSLPDPAKGFDMGITTFPFFKDHPWVGPSGFMEGLIISKTSKNPDIAFQVISHLSSDEVQIEAAKRGNIPVVTNVEAQRSLHADNPLAKGIDFEKFFKVKPADSYIKTKYDAGGRSAVIKYLREFIDGKLDLNTALRQADEENNINIETQKSK